MSKDSKQDGYYGSQCELMADYLYEIREARPHMTMHEAFETAMTWPGEPHSRERDQKEKFMSDDELISRMRRWIKFFGDNAPKG
jgi:hypothetical protein